MSCVHDARIRSARDRVAWQRGLRRTYGLACTRQDKAWRGRATHLPRRAPRWQAYPPKPTELEP
eukprot:5309133-Alexandrium_andersonii.AAC.1